MMTDNKTSPTIKTIVVECRFKDSTETKKFNVDSDIFDDPELEAATRFAEEHVIKPNAKIPPCLNTYEDGKSKKIQTYNSYYVIVNAGFFKKAEIMRINFKNISNIDLKDEPLRG